MKRRRLVRYAGAGVLAAVGTGLIPGWERAAAQTNETLSVQALGHMCFLITGSGQRVLINPFRSLGCTAGYRPPTPTVDLVLISSQLLDEGAVEIVPGNPRLLYEPGIYELGGKRIQGIRMDHDRVGGRRFGINVAWQWNQAGMSVVHLGGAAAPISVEQKILIGRPDVLFLPVGGGPKAYTPEEAKAATSALNPRLIIPMQYRTQAAQEACDLVPIDNFLSLMSGTPVRRVGDTATLKRADLPAEGMVIQVMSYRF
jgi:L-ascorbate metabolism protein UlaG (beta-lactamase superfamily)